MKLQDKITAGGVFGVVGGIAVHVLSDMFFTSNNFGMAMLIIGFCAIAGGKMLGEMR